MWMNFIIGFGGFFGGRKFVCRNLRTHPFPVLYTLKVCIVHLGQQDGLAGKKYLSEKPGYLSSTPELTAERENQLLEVALWPLHACHGMCVAHIHTIIIRVCLIIKSKNTVTLLGSSVSSFNPRLWHFLCLFLPPVASTCLQSCLSLASKSPWCNPKWQLAPAHSW